MEIKIIKLENEVVCKTIGPIDTLTSPDLENAMLPLCDLYDKVVLDLKDSLYMSSAGLRVVLSVGKKMHNKQFVLKNVCDTIYDIFVSTGFINILNIED